MNFGPITTRCPVCGRMIVTMWQEFWTYRRGETFYCSDNCLNVDLTRDTKAMNAAKKRRKGAKTMYNKIRKDGTPAKKSGPKAKGVVKKPEAEEIVIHAPEKEEEKPINQIGFKICAIEGEFGRFLYDKKFNRIDWTTPEGEEVSMDPFHWRLFIKQMPRVLDVLIAEGSK